MLKITRVTIQILLFSLLINNSNQSCAAEKELNKAKIIEEIKIIMSEQYIFLDTAEATNDHLDKLVSEHFFAQYTTPKEFARALTKEMRRFTKDKHIAVIPPRPQNAQPRQEEFPKTHSFDRHLNGLMQFRSGGFGEVNFFDGNVAYFRLDGFRREEKFQIDPLMEYLSTADAIIIDLRYNGGGGSIVNYLSSYFLPSHIRLSSTYTRRSDSTKHYKTVPVNGRKRLDVPLLILTSERTFSAAEAFSYNLQAQHRATIIGEPTGGGAHPVDRMRLSHGLSFIVPYARSINPVTKTNWEGTGVIPDIQTTADHSLNKAKELAKIKATVYREAPFKELEQILNQDALSLKDDDKVLELLALILSRHHLEDFMVHNIALEYKRLKNFAAVRAVLKANVKLFPDNPQAHHSYAKALAENNQPQRALAQYQLAVQLAKQQSSQLRTQYQADLADYKTKLKP